MVPNIGTEHCNLQRHICSLHLAGCYPRLFLDRKEHKSTDNIGFVAEKVCGIFVRVQILAVNRLMPPSFHRHYSMGWPHMVIIVRLLLEELSVWMLSSQMMLQLTLSKDSWNGNTSLLLVDNV